jgi:hypothetical protein
VNVSEDAHEYKASLRVCSETVGLAELRARLGEPTSAYDIGDPVSRRSEAPTRRAALWRFDSGLDRKRPLDEHIAALIAVVEVRQDAFDSLRDLCDIDLFCGVFSAKDAQGGFVLEPSLSRRLSDLRLPVVFDIY